MQTCLNNPRFFDAIDPVFLGQEAMMGKPNFSDEFKRDAAAQITEREDPVAEVS